MTSDQAGGVGGTYPLQLLSIVQVTHKYCPLAVLSPGPCKMESEPEYQRVLAFLDQLKSMNASLNERALLMSYSETTRAIELHFEKCLRALCARKEALLSNAASKLQLHKKIIEGQQKEVNDSLSGCTRILEGGTLLYPSNKEIAVAIWKNIATIDAPKLEEAIVGVKLPEMVMDVIGTHGTVTSETKRISRSKAGYVSTLPLQSRELETQLVTPSAIHFNPQDGLYVCDASSNIIKKVSLQGIVTPVTNSGNFKSLGGISIYHKESIIYASDTAAHTIKKRTTSGFFGAKVEVFAGSSSPGYRDGTGTHTSFKCPGALTVDQLTGDIYVADVGNHTIRKITSQGVVSTIAGSGIAGSVDGIGATAMFNLNENTDIWFCDKTQLLFVCEGNKLRVVTIHNGEVSTLPCNINTPRGVIALADGSILVSSTIDHKIFHIKKQGKEKYDVTVLVGLGESGWEDGVASLCKLSSPRSLAFDETTSTCYVADFGNHSIRKFTFV